MTTTPTPPNGVPPADAPSSENPAVLRCLDAYRRAWKTQKAKGQSDPWARNYAEKAYRDAMPKLSGEKNIGDFIACVADGILVGAITIKEATTLFYAAQVAISALGRGSASRKDKTA